ncbi:MAG: hypothetical protein PHX80_04830 [Candidatus Nanoarchaeia archaeon]|nr:hypothetical protein [Candidatus Nanoarchaeia archaeon]
MDSTTKQLILPVILLSAIAGLLIYGFISTQIKLRKCLNTQVTTDTVITTELIRDTVFVTIFKPVPKPYAVHDTFQPVDTAWILEDYNLIYAYSDTLTDSTLEAIINTEIFQNKMLSRDFRYRLLSLQQQTITVTKTIDNSPGFYLGGGVGYLIPGKKVGLDISAGYMDRKNRLYGLSYDPVNSLVYGRVQFKLKRKN